MKLTSYANFPTSLVSTFSNLFGEFVIYLLENVIAFCPLVKQLSKNMYMAFHPELNGNTECSDIRCGSVEIKSPTCH